MRRINSIVRVVWVFWLGAYIGAQAQVDLRALPAHPRLLANTARFAPS